MGSHTCTWPATASRASERASSHVLHPRRPRFFAPVLARELSPHVASSHILQQSHDAFYVLQNIEFISVTVSTPFGEKIGKNFVSAHFLLSVARPPFRAWVVTSLLPSSYVTMPAPLMQHTQRRSIARGPRIFFSRRNAPLKNRESMHEGFTQKPARSSWAIPS